jgi:hypothetical protein
MDNVMNNIELTSDIEAAFPDVPMPPKADLSFHREGCSLCEFLGDDLDDYRGKEVTTDLIRYLHHELSCLSTAGLKWILPHYLKYCLTPEAEYNQMETEFMIYHLGPAAEFQEETLQQLAGFSQEQIECLARFLEWCSSHPKWSEYCGEDVDRALGFVRTVNA